MRALVTGVAGFAGRYLARHLLAQGDTVIGLVRKGRRLQDADLSAQVPLIEVDLSDRADVRAGMADAAPDVIYHLAAQASVAVSLEDPIATFENNVVGQATFFEAILDSGAHPRILVVGSNEEYGPVPPEHLPIKETTALNPVSPYAVSKVAQDLMAAQYWVTRKLPAIRVRPFTHTGPEHDDRFVTPSFARQIAEIELDRREPVVRVGFIDGVRDFSDVRDIVVGYRLAALKGVPGDVYNLGSGRGTPVRALLEGLLALTDASIRIELDQSLIRPSEPSAQYADCSKFAQLTGWTPRITLEQTLQDTLAYWRLRTRQQR
ncbi:MAG: GDP-mannose 4,6-dehydratase [Chloroflexota bacterium]